MMGGPEQAVADATVTPGRTGRLGRKRLAVAIVALVFAIVAALLLLRDSRIPPLAEVALDDGTVLQLRHVASSTGGFNSFQLRPAIPSSDSVRKQWGQLFPEWLASTTEVGGTSCWLSLWDPHLKAPVDVSRIGYCVLVDAHGWPHPALGFYRTYFAGGRFNLRYRGEGFAVRAIDEDGRLEFGSFSPLPPDDYREVLLGVSFPPLPAQACRLQAYTRVGELLGEFPIEIAAGPPPAPPGFQAPALPVTITQSQLAVTLVSLKLDPLPRTPAGLNAFRIVPEFSLSWAGGDAGGWTVPKDPLLYIWDDHGNTQTSDRCTLSPLAGAWTLELEVSPSSGTAAHRADQHAMIEEFAVPAMGEIVDIDREVTLDGVRIQLLKLLSPGRHEFTLDSRFASHALKAANMMVGPLSGGGIAKVVQSVTVSEQGLRVVSDRDYPTLFFLHEGSGKYHVQLRFFSDGPERLDSDYFRSEPLADSTQQLEFTQLHRLPPQVARLRVEVLVQRPLSFQFTVKPPAWPSDENLDAQPREGK